MGYYILYMRSNETVDDITRKKFMDSLYGDYLNRKYGMLDKFNKAIGFGDLVDDYVKSYPTITPAKITSPEDYKYPSELLSEATHIDLEKKGILKFVVEDKEYKHTISKYNYSAYDILKKFEKFLSKVYSDAVFDIQYQEKYCPKLKIVILDWFYKGMSSDDIPYTAELSSHRLLSKAEISFIENRLKQFHKSPFHIEQYWCKTCYGYHKESPYHIEIVYD